jgi:hypothetical protein
MEERRRSVLSGAAFDALEARLRGASGSPDRLAAAIRRTRRRPLRRWLLDVAVAVARRFGLRR